MQLEIDRDQKSRKAEKQSNNALRIEPVIVCDAVWRGTGDDDARREGSYDCRWARSVR
jgi:hypothetical protein